MSEYIKKDTVIDRLSHNPCASDYLLDILADIECIPSADVVEVKHGKWIDDEGQRVLMENEIAKGENWKVCSVCGVGMCIGAKYETDRRYHPFFQSYCPNCGAKMDNAYEDVKEQEHER